MLTNLSLSSKVPLRVSLLILIVGVAVTASLLMRAYQVFKEDLLLSSENMGRIMSHSLTTAMLQDDTWKAYEIINTPFNIDTPKGALQANNVIILNANNLVYISIRPMEYPMLTDPTDNDPELARLIQHISELQGFKQFTFENSTFGHRYVVTPIESDNVLLGTVVMSYSKEIYFERFATFAKLASGTLLIMIILMLPLGAYWGRRIAQPLIELSNCMSLIGSQGPDELEYQVMQTGDEIEKLGHQFLIMVEELREKNALELQMVSTQRLAAIGQFTAGIAHEINNPLGGMLNATNTLRKHGNNDPLTQKTVQLLERGLLQIKDTVGALLLEASPDHHPLSHQDIEDTHTLVQQEASKLSTQINWNNEITGLLPLPSTLVRQAMINLLLNAIQASPEQGRIDCDIRISESCLNITITNNGDEISDETLHHLFEPFISDKKSGRGLGLWVTYQIVEKLHGDIEVSTGAEYTQFTLRIPIPIEDAI